MQGGGQAKWIFKSVIVFISFSLTLCNFELAKKPTVFTIDRLLCIYCLVKCSNFNLCFCDSNLQLLAGGFKIPTLPTHFLFIFIFLQFQLRQLFSVLVIQYVICLAKFINVLAGLSFLYSIVTALHVLQAPTLPKPVVIVVLLWPA